MKLQHLQASALFLAAAVVYAIGAATRVAVPGMVLDTVRADLHLSASQAAFIGSAGVFGCLIFIAFSGWLIDRFGWKRMIFPGVALQVLGEYLLYSSATPLAVYAGAFLNGGGRTIGYLVLLKCIDVSFDRRYFGIFVGLFYLFSYGGTALGSSSLCLNLLETHTWQRILADANFLTLLCGGLILLLLIGSRRRADAPSLSTAPSTKPSLRTLALTLFHDRAARACFGIAMTGILIYWSFMGVMARKFLAELPSVSPHILDAMNALIILEMVFGGTLSYLCGNCHRYFQRIGAGALVIFAVTLFLATFPAIPGRTLWGMTAYVALGLGYGLTCINITAVREYVPTELVASVIGFVNFTANILMIALVQWTGCLFDSFSTGESGLGVLPLGYRIPALIYCFLALWSALGTRRLTH